MGSESQPNRSHRWLGEQLDLFHFPDYAPGQVCWHPPGMVLWNALAEMWRELNAAHGYQEVRSPQLCDRSLWKRSGHWEKFRDKMYSLEHEGREQALKPMNCPGHCEFYNLRPRSYRELPLRLAEMGHVHRSEPSGSLNGLLRVRSFVQDDAHIFARQDQAAAEARACLELADSIYRRLGLPVRAELSLRPLERLGSDELWDEAEQSLREALAGAGLEFEERPGEGAFYGPKVDLHVEDSLGRSWQMGSVQLDCQLPIRFELFYVNEAGGSERPVIIHRALFGSFERFVGILLEHYDGQFPLWLAPEAVRILPIGADQAAYAGQLKGALQSRGVRAGIAGEGPLGGRIREAELGRVPVMAVVGAREVEGRAVALRRRGERSQHVLGFEEAVDCLGGEVAARAA